MKKSVGRLLAVLFLLFLILNPSLSAKGAADGLALWGNAVVPALLPFMIGTGVVVGLQATDLLIRPVFPILKRFFGLSSDGAFVMVCGLLCGYPMGAKLDGEFLNGGRISLRQSRYLLAICSHPSPMFLLGYTAAQLKEAGAGNCALPLLASVYLPIFLLSFLSKKRYGWTSTPTKNIPPPSKTAPFSFDRHMMSSFETMIRIGGYIMLFSIASAYLEHFLSSPVVSAVLMGVLEITTGIRALCASMPTKACLPLTAATVSFGGLSGIFQVKSVLKNPELSIRDYVLWKCLHGVLSGILMTIFLRF